MTIDELKRALECHAKDDCCCSVCPFNDSENCSEDMALAALDALDTKAEPIDQRQMALKTVMMALDKGGYSVTIQPDGTIICHPWFTEETLELSMVAKFLDNYIRRVEFNVSRMDETFMKGGWEKVLRKAIEDGEFDDLGDDT